VLVPLLALPLALSNPSSIVKEGSSAPPTSY
jgi:hypothetical protein